MATQIPFWGKEKRLSLGVYPDISLKEARERRDDARKLLANEIDPSENRKAVKAAKVERAGNIFEVVAREWYAKHSPNWSANHGNRIIRRLERDIFPWLGGKPIAEISAPQLLEVIRRIEQRGALETAHRALGNCGQVFRYAVATGRAERDPSGDLRGALPPAKGTHFASVTEPKKVAEPSLALDMFQSTHPRRVRHGQPRFHGVLDVSIHAPTQGATNDNGKRCRRYRGFNPRTHAGCDQLSKRWAQRVTEFQSTHPRRVRLDSFAAAIIEYAFQSTHPRRVRPHKLIKAFDVLEFQSTHPRRVRQSPACHISARDRFNPRTHAGCDLRTNPCFRYIKSFNPRTHAGCDCAG